MSIEVRNLRKRFDDFDALKNINLTLQDGKLTALLGPSGSGKTTLLRIIAGLESADSGEVRFFGEDITKQSPKNRGIGFVFQHYALFKHMTVFENIAFGLNVRPKATRPSKDAIKAKVAVLLKMVQLESLAKRYPSELVADKSSAWLWLELWRLSQRFCCLMSLLVRLMQRCAWIYANG